MQHIVARRWRTNTDDALKVGDLTLRLSVRELLRLLLIAQSLSYDIKIDIPLEKQLLLILLRRTITSLLETSTRIHDPTLSAPQLDPANALLILRRRSRMIYLA